MEKTTVASSGYASNVFAKNKDFWNNYLEGRPTAPPCFFERLFRYHEAHHGHFGTVHDVGAGNGPYASVLRSKFAHVIVSDIAAENVALAEKRLGADGFSYRVSRLEDGDDILPGSVDMVFATNVLHFCDQDVALKAVARQLRPGGTFACAAFGAAQFADARVQDIYTRIGHAGARILLGTLHDPEKLVRAMDRTQGDYNVAPLNQGLFLPGAQRVSLNMPVGGITSPLPPEMEVAQRDPSYVGANDVLVHEEEDGWSFVMDIGQIRAHVESFPFGKDVASVLGPLWREMEDAVQGRRIGGYWPAKIILATRNDATVDLGVSE
ncbi:hypothetical protein E4U43_003923 [Claviceps pusilla]|uniref:Methyltransferase type 11 domain-containing protein n=1 Tax=Claviceps pusilla TaxID=123648 RepID=A0A9P7NFG8_9HYPO|nr:hypothetical protein E4U43_003923 [Claviceps pusilla]